MTTLPTQWPCEGSWQRDQVVAQVNDRYTLLSHLGHGGMGVVFRARDRLTGEIVALKRMTDPATAQEAMVHCTMGPVIGTMMWETERRRRLTLAREFRALATLRHPNIISVLDYGFASNGEPFFTMELIEHRQTLLEAARGLAAGAKVELLVQVLRALSYLHRRGVIHRDLKPSNVLVDDRVRVLDFGIAIHRGEHERASGTLSHMAPEVLQGQPCAEPADLYAVGVMGYEIFAEHHPFHGFTGDALRAAVLASEPDLRELAGASDELKRALAGLLCKDPCKRYATADAAIDALIEAARLESPRHTQATRDSFLHAASFVGRLDEQRALTTAVDRLMSGRGGVWMVEGESGIGKTRLLDEIRTLALVGGARVIRGQADSEARGPFELWREPLRHLLLGTEVTPEEAGTLAALVPDIAELLGQPVTPIPVEAHAVRSQMITTIRVVFARQQAPVLVILEDLHWVHDGLDVLRELALQLPSVPVLVIGSFRSEEAPGLAKTIPDASHLRLGRLSRSDIATLAGSMLGSVQVPVVDFLDHHTEGNVFFLVEAVRALAEECGSLDRVGGSPLPERLVTSGIEAVIARRLDKLPGPSRPVLAWSAVVGRVLDQVLLEDVFGRSQVAEALAFGTETAVVEVSDNCFRFAHDKFRERTLERLAPARKRELHGEVAAAIERVHGTGKAWAAALAHHYREAERPDREAAFCALAGQAALEQGAYGDATRLLERAIALYKISPSSDRVAELDALLHYGAVLRGTHSWATPEVKGVYDRVIELAAQIGAEQRAIPAMHGLALNALFRGDLATARELAVRYGKLADASDDVFGQIQAAVILANVATWLGCHDEAEPFHRKVIELYEPSQQAVHMARYGWDPRIASSVNHAASTCIRGEPDLAVAMYRESLAAARASGHPFAIAIALENGAWVHYLRRDVQDTLDYARALAEVAEPHKFLVFVVLADAFSGWAMTQLGHPAAGLDRLRSAVATQRRIAGLATTLYAAQLAEACLITGAVDEALVVLQETLADQVTTQERCYHPELYRLLGVAWQMKHDDERAAAARTKARELADVQGARLFARRLAG